VRMDGLRWHVLTAVVIMLLYSSRCFASSTTPLLWPVACGLLASLAYRPEYAAFTCLSLDVDVVWRR
jgi:hypothetical protein